MEMSLVERTCVVATWSEHQLAHKSSVVEGRVGTKSLKVGSCNHLAGGAAADSRGC